MSIYIRYLVIPLLFFANAEVMCAVKDEKKTDITDIEIRDKVVTKNFQTEITTIIKWPKKWGYPQEKSKHCEYDRDNANQLVCMLVKNEPVYLSWGSMWLPVRIKQEDEKDEVIVLGASHMLLAWSQQEIEYLLKSTANANKDVCLITPSYNLVSVAYCQKKTFKTTSCSEIDIKIKNTAITLPNLARANWKKNALPQSAYLKLKKTSVNPRFKDVLVIPVRNINKSHSSTKNKKKYNIQLDALLNIDVPDKPEVGYDLGSHLWMFETRDDCIKSNIEGIILETDYRKSELEKVKTHSCTWAKVVKSGSDVSFCIQAKKKRNKLSFDFSPNKFSGKRKIVVIANSQSLAQDSRGTALQRALTDWLISFKKKRKPLNLLTIEGDGVIKQVLKGEDLLLMEDTSSKNNTKSTIEEKIYSDITFYAKGFQPLKDLEYVEHELYALGIKDIEKVLYLADDTLPYKIFNADLGTPLGWKNDGVQLHVITNGGCAHWKRAKAECTILESYPKIKEITTLLENFEK